MGPPLQCFNPQLYARLSDCEKEPRVCIAPTARRTRCRWTISAKDLEEATRLKHIVARLEIGSKRNILLARFVLLHCCQEQHRDKLEADRTGCLEEIVKSYGTGIPAIKGVDVEVKQCSTPTPQARVIKTAVTSQPQAAAASQDTHRYELRSNSQTTAIKDEPQAHKIPTSIFVRYKSDPKDTIRGHLLDNVPSDWDLRGQVYFFSWPSQPGYVKIGFSSRSAAMRVLRWQSCNPGAVLQKSIYVDWPERIERLIHLQMAEHRCKITICAECKRSHHEWFKMSIDDATQLFNDWASLTTRESLYDSSRTLTTAWQKRIESFKGDITARALLDLLDAEAASMKQKEQVTVEQHNILSEPQPVAAPIEDAVPKDRSTLIDLAQHDQILAFFSDFMRLMADDESLRQISSKPETLNHTLLASHVNLNQQIPTLVASVA